MSGALDLSKVTRQQPDSLLREEIIIDMMDRRSQIEKYENRLKLWLREEDAIEQIDACLAILDVLGRPWDIDDMNKRMATTGENLIRQYAEKFPEALKEEE